MDWAAIFESGFRGFLGPEAITFALAAIGLNIHFGYTGLLNFGQAVFMAAGAYGVAMFTSPDSFGMNLGVGLLMGVIVFPLIVALILGIPTLRLRADYLAIVTIAAAEVVRLLLRSPKFDDQTGSSDGLGNFTKDFYDLSPFEPGKRYFFNLFVGNQMFVVIVGWIVVAIVVGIVYLMVNSPWGRVLKAIREDEDAARSLGKNAYSYKMQALIVGGIIGAMAGIVRALANGVAQPDNFITDVTFQVWVALILGGVARVIGPVIGAMILWFVFAFSDALLRQSVENEYIPEWLMEGTQVGQVRFMLVGLGLALLAIFRPQGLLGNKEEMALDDR